MFLLPALGFLLIFESRYRLRCKPIIFVGHLANDFRRDKARLAGALEPVLGIWEPGHSGNYAVWLRPATNVRLEHLIGKERVLETKVLLPPPRVS